ncbi:unnamed protein product [Dicrocoelium dendriticum]|nr:unnamed protein product [Dicrocoelium dendriticum]
MIWVHTPLLLSYLPGTRSFMSGTASSGAKCVRTANTHTDHSTASSSRQMSAPVPCNSIKRPVTSTRLRQPGKPTQGRAIASSRSTTGTFADRLSVKFKLDKPKSLDWTSTLMAELEAYEDPKAYLFHRMFQGSELAEAVTDDVFESVISLSFSSSHKTVSPPGANADPDPTLPEEPSQHNSSLPVRCTATRQKPPNIGNVVTNRLKEVNGRHPGDITAVADGITTAVNLKEGELSSPSKLTAIPSVVTSSLTSHQNVPNSTVCLASPSTISHTSPMPREKPLRITDQADTSELLNYSLIVGASVTSLAPSDAGTYVIAKHHTLTDESFFIHHEPEPDSLTPRGSLVDLLEVPEMPQASSSTDPISADYDPESSQMTRRDLVYQGTGPEYIATSRHLNTDSAVNSNGIVLTDTEDTGISVCSSTHGTKTTFPVAERYQDDLDLNRTAHSLGQLDDSLLVSASIISLAPSCTGTYILDVDDTLASQGVPPVVIQSREDLLHSVESLSQPRLLADPKSIDDLTPAQGHHSSRSLLWMTTGDQREDYVMIGSPPQLLTPRHVSHFDANGLTVTNSLGVPHEYRGFGTVNKDSNLKSPQPSPKSPEAITSSNRSAPVEANHVPLELHGQSEIFHNIGTAVQSSHRDMNALPSTTSGFNGSQASVASAQFFAQDSTHKVNSDALLSGTRSRSRPSAYPVRLPRPAQSPTLSSESSSPTQQSTTPPFADKLRDHKVSPLLLSTTGTALSVIEPLADIHDCYQALHASVNYLIQQSDGSVGAREQGPPCEKLGHQNLERPMNVLRSLNKWSTTRASIAPIWRNDMIPPLYGTQKFVGRQHCYCLQRQSTASLDSALDGFRDVLASACGNHPVTTTCNGSASVPQPSSPLQAGSRPFPWLFPTENSAQENTSNPPWVHPSTTSGGVQKGSWYVIQPRTSDHSFPSSSTNFHGRDTAGVAATSEPHSAPPPPDSAAACTHVTDSQTLTTQQVTQGSLLYYNIMKIVPSAPV